MRLSRNFFNRPTLRVARELVGCTLVVRQGRCLRRGVIIETEAYVGPRDQASHASRGRTPRTEVMFGEPGHLYVYLIYGVHYCVNVVTERATYPAAVLIRSIVPLTSSTEVSGPGRVCKYLGITRKFNNEDVVASRRVWFERGTVVPPSAISREPRIGVDYAGAWRLKPWRFSLRLEKKNDRIR